MQSIEKKPSLIDVHNHLLFGLDDGASSEKEMLRMLDDAASQGVEGIIATPHAHPGVVRFDWVRYKERLHCANDYCSSKQYKLKIYPGSEILYTEAAVRLLQEHSLPTMNNTVYVLVEWPGDEAKACIWDSVRNLANAGFVPIIAHVERMKRIISDPYFIQELKNTFEAGIQIDCSTIIENRQQTHIRRLFEMELVDYVASDAHGTERRCMIMLRTFQKIAELYGDEIARTVMITNPGKILSP